MTLQTQSLPFNPHITKALTTIIAAFLFIGLTPAQACQQRDANGNCIKTSASHSKQEHDYSKDTAGQSIFDPCAKNKKLPGCENK
jgi:hypothetical protein